MVGGLLHDSVPRTKSARMSSNMAAMCSPWRSPRTGTSCARAKGAFVIENAPYISWTFRTIWRDCCARSIFRRTSTCSLTPPGLVLRDRSGGRHPLGGPGVEARIIRNGTRAVALRYTGGFDMEI